MIADTSPLFPSSARTASAFALSLALAVGPVTAQDPPPADMPAGTISIEVDAHDDEVIRRRMQDILGQVEGLGGVSVDVDPGGRDADWRGHGQRKNRSSKHPLYLTRNAELIPYL